MASLTTSEFIQQIFIDELGHMIHIYPYQSFMVMATGIEFLGKCINSSPTWSTERKSKIDFNNAIDNITAFSKYRQYASYDLYDNLRCGILHTAAPKSKITLSSKNEEAHLVEKNGILNLRCEDFFIDFKSACEEVINNSDNSSKFKARFLNTPDKAHGIEAIMSSGSTEVINSKLT